MQVKPRWDLDFWIGSLVAVLMLFLIGGTFYRSTVSFQDAVAQRRHCLAVIIALERVLDVAQDAESSARGYALTGSELYLAPYETAVGDSYSPMDRLRELLRDSHGQEAQLDSLQSLMEQRIALSQTQVNLRRASGLAAVAQQIATGEDLQVTRKIRAIVASMESDELLFLAEIDRTVTSRQRAIRAMTYASLGFACLIMVSASVVILRAKKRREMAEESLRRASGRLQAVLQQMPAGVVLAEPPSGKMVFSNAAMGRIFRHPFQAIGSIEENRGYLMFHPGGQLPQPPEDTGLLQPLESALSRTLLWGEVITAEELHITRGDGTQGIVSTSATPVRDLEGNIVAAVTVLEDITDRRMMEMEIRQLNETLRRKASSLDAANRELEAFSYSVSHDLRAPLRHLSGFLELLAEHIVGSLDAKGRHYLDTLLDSARQMGLLIDDLLAFSRSGRVETRMTKVAMADSVEQVRQELAQDLGARNVVWTIEPLPEVTGDPALLKQVLANLLGNAIKYTRIREEAAIEVGCREEGAEWVFFVRDNGVGFDMRYASKLFGVFQRLHSSNEFEGTGVGLATVQRIIGRHGGRVWAAGVLDQGATFYFSLPKWVSEEEGRHGREPGESIATQEEQPS